jgi:glycosyltransferase involved in cell wall biosynthesis
LIKRITNSLSTITEHFEIILIDDGSSDTTWELISKNSKNSLKIKGIKLSRNFGQHYAITAGLDMANGDWAIVMDGDLQDRPELIPELYSKANEGFDVVFVSRKDRPEGLIYKIIQKIYYLLLSKLSGIDFDSTQANFSIINRKVIMAFRKFPESARFYGSTVKWLGFRTTSLEAKHGNRYGGKTSYTLKSRVNLAMDVITAFSDRPLKFAIGLGISMTSIALFMASWIIIGSFKWGFTEVGWASIMAVVLVSTGSILIVLGIIGIYIGRVFREVKNRPLYVIDELKNI